MGLIVGGHLSSDLVRGTGSLHHFSRIRTGSARVSGFFAALVGALWAYDGWNNVSMVASEIKHPQRNLPARADLRHRRRHGDVPAVNIAYFYVLARTEVAHTDQVAAGMMAQTLRLRPARAVTVAVMISILAALNGSILSGARVPYAMARDGYFFKAHRRRASEVQDAWKLHDCSLSWSAI